MDTLWALLLAFLFAFLLAFAVGANDSANSWGTSVGAGTLSLKWACALGSIMETLGAVFLSGNVIRKITTGIIDISLYQTDISNATINSNFTDEALVPETELMLGAVATMFGSSIWQLVATWLAWPVSGTHSIVSGLLGFTLVAHGTAGVNWSELVKVIIGWFTSPILAAVLTSLLYWPLKRWCLSARADVFRFWNKVVFSLLWGLTIGFDVGTVLTTGDIFFDLTGWVESGYFWAISVGVGAIVTILALFGLLPLLQKRAEKLRDKPYTSNCETSPTDQLEKVVEKLENVTTVGISNPAFDEIGEEDVAYSPSESIETPAKLCCITCPTKADAVDDNQEQELVFRPLQVLSACTGALAHGGNDVGNAIGPCVLVWLIYDQPLAYSTDAPYWLLAYGGVGISLGLILFGKRVIRTMGTNITRMTPSRGFCVEICAAITVIIASILGLPVSTTHCQVGALIAAGLISGGPKSVDFRLFGQIAASWVATVPFAMGLSAFLYWLLTLIMF